MLGILLNNNLRICFWWYISVCFNTVNFCTIDSSVSWEALFGKRFEWNWSSIHSLFSCKFVFHCCYYVFIVVVVRYSARMSLFVNHCIIRVICLLILLSYTLIASTSLQLLLPPRYTDIKEWYTYSSPYIQYFHERHIIYVVVAVISEIVVQ